MSTRHPSHPHHLHSSSRRDWLRRTAAMATVLGTGGAANLLLGSRQLAHAADYKALVCIFLYGGNDGMNMVVPTDATRHGQYAGVRGPLALPQDALVPLEGSDFGLHPSLSAIAPLWSQGALVPVFNVGPLYAPVTKEEFRNAGEGSPLVPDSLFSHSDQQLLWESGGSSTQERTGWGGRGSDVLNTVNPVISVGGNARFGAEALRSPLVLPGPGATFGAYGLGAKDMVWRPNLLRKEAIDALYAAPSPTDVHQAFVDQQAFAFEMAERLGPLVASVPGDALALPAIDAAFAPLMTGTRFNFALAAQLYQVAKLIANNATVQGSRQMFFAGHGGYDTHFGQVAGGATQGPHAFLLKELGDAMAAFQQAMVNLGLGRVVTTFTESDFGRTFAPNLSNGTDHAWGNHQLVMGESVKGHLTYGRYPELTLGGPDDVGEYEWELQGRWIPTSAVDQFAATLLQWFGANTRELDRILPNLGNFGKARSLGFL
jgi:uncharacterized protein (DUF1501 family)